MRLFRFFGRKNGGEEEKEVPASRPKVVKRIVVGFMISGAIASIVGKKLIDQKRKEKGDDEPLEEDEEQ